VAVLTVSAPVFTLVGALGAATLIWRAGRPALGATLAGAAMVLQMLALAAGAVAVIATILRSGEAAARPRPRVTLAAALAPSRRC
jgi:hypothetical protein